MSPSSAISKAFHSPKVQTLLEWGWVILIALAGCLSATAVLWYNIERTNERALDNEEAIGAEVAERMEADKEIRSDQLDMARQMADITGTIRSVDTNLNNIWRSLDEQKVELRELRRERSRAID